MPSTMDSLLCSLPGQKTRTHIRTSRRPINSLPWCEEKLSEKLGKKEMLRRRQRRKAAATSCLFDICNSCCWVASKVGRGERYSAYIRNWIQAKLLSVDLATFLPVCVRACVCVCLCVCASVRLGKLRKIEKACNGKLVQVQKRESCQQQCCKWKSANSNFKQRNPKT